MKRLTIALFILMAGACGDGGEEPAELTYPPDSTQFGLSMGEWAAEWWQWALAIPADTNPILGGACDQGQTGDVFFLAGNFGEVESRSCTIPAGKAIFFPVLNIVCYPSPENPAEGCDTPDTEAELTACANGGIDGATATELAVEIDGVPVSDPGGYRAQSGLFSWTTPAMPLDPAFGPIEPNECGIPVGDRFGVTDGYWYMLQPLSPGEHTVRFSGSVTYPDGFVFALELDYAITQL